MSIEAQWVWYLVGAYALAAFTIFCIEFILGPREDDDDEQMEYLAKYDMKRRKK